MGKNRSAISRDAVGINLINHIPMPSDCTRFCTENPAKARFWIFERITESISYVFSTRGNYESHPLAKSFIINILTPITIFIFNRI